MHKKVYISSLNGNLLDKLLNAFEWIGLDSIVKPENKVFLKPNFTFPFYKRAVTTSPELIEAVVSILKRRTKNIVIGESDGAAAAWTVKEAFGGHKIPQICRRYGISMIDLTNSEGVQVKFKLNKKILILELPKILLNDTDVFITLPVPKIHCMTKVSLALKNQWGCIPLARKRFRYHPYFDNLVCELNKIINPKIVIADCSYMLTCNGPMFGEEVKTNMLVVSNDIGSFELSMLHIMGLDKWDISHINAAKKAGIIPKSIDEIEFNTDWAKYKMNDFFLKRTIQNYLALFCFKSRFMTWVAYESPVSGLIHRILYAIKENPLKEAIEKKKNE